MKITPKELDSLGYEKLDELAHNDIVPFIRKSMKSRTTFSIFYNLFNTALVGLVGYYFIKMAIDGSEEIGEYFGYFSYGLLIAFLLVPIHEYIHVVAYKSQGAANTSYDMNIKKFYFMALADKFVASRKEFTVVALAPFVVITAMAVILSFFTGSIIDMTILGTVLAHSAMCSGDFGLLSYFEIHKNKELVTYDDVPRKISYFYFKGTSNSTEA